MARPAPASDPAFADPIRKQLIERFSIPEPNSGCWLWTGTLSKKGYGRFSRDQARQRQAHRYSYESFHGAIPGGLLVMHKCDTHCCVNPDHLVPATNDENMKDMARKNRGAIGDRNHNTKLTAVDVVEMRRAHARGESLHSLGRRFGVAQRTARFAVERRTWRHVP